MKALPIIVAAYSRLNVLSPGEALSAEDAAYGLDQLNELVDELSAPGSFLFQDVRTSASQTGSITLGSGSWVAIAPGSEIVSAACAGLALAPLTTAQYLALPTPATTGTPRTYTYDGMSSVLLYPVPAGQTVSLETRRGVQAFADQNTTDYILAPGYRALLVASLAVRLAPNTVGDPPRSLVDSERRMRHVLRSSQPAVIDAPCARGNILTGWR